jgi:hypothetical protein
MTRESELKNERERYNNKKLRGLCTKCGKNSPLSGKLKCQVCTDRQSKSSRKVYLKRIKNGICGVCGKRPLLTTVHCSICNENANASHKKLEQIRKKQNTCVKGDGKPIAPNSNRFCQEHLDKSRKTTKRCNLKTKKEVMSHYSSNGVPHCNICGVTNLQYLTIDHINGDGREHREKNGLQGSKIYHWLRKNDYPTDFQVLCYNHNMAKRHNSPEGWDEPYTFTEK